MIVAACICGIIDFENNDETIFSSAKESFVELILSNEKFIQDFDKALNRKKTDNNSYDEINENSCLLKNTNNPNSNSKSPLIQK